MRCGSPILSSISRRSFAGICLRISSSIACKDLLGAFDARARRGADMQLDQAGIHSRKEVGADEDSEALRRPPPAWRRRPAW